MEGSQQSQRGFKKKEHTINTGASDHVFKPKNKRRGEKNSRIGIFTRRNSKGCFSLQALLSCSYRVSQLKEGAIPALSSPFHLDAGIAHNAAPSTASKQHLCSDGLCVRACVCVLKKAVDEDARSAEKRGCSLSLLARVETGGKEACERLDDTKHTFFMPPIRGRG